MLKVQLGAEIHVPGAAQACGRVALARLRRLPSLQEPVLGLCSDGALRIINIITVIVIVLVTSSIIIIIDTIIISIIIIIIITPTTINYIITMITIIFNVIISFWCSSPPFNSKAKAKAKHCCVGPATWKLSVALGLQLRCSIDP